MKKVELVCHYCNSAINLYDDRCPNCGASCTGVINEYKREQERIARNKEYASGKEISKTFMSTGNAVAAIFIIPIVAVLVGLVLAGVLFIRSFDFTSNNVSSLEDENLEVGYNEVAKTEKMNVTLSEYELYEYKSDEFPTYYNTPDGYQKIAFLFTIKNKSNEELNTYFDADISLTADDYNVESSDLEKCIFCYTAVGKDSYQEIEGLKIKSGEQIKGYVGYLVPKDKKALKFRVGDDVVITMDNPAYEQ